jgi:hypothetical protein
MDKPQPKENHKRRFGIKSKLILLETFAILLLIAVGFVLYSRFQKANQVLQVARQLEEEKTGCSEFLSSGSGDFGRFQYCTRLLQTFTK